MFFFPPIHNRFFLRWAFCLKRGQRTSQRPASDATNPSRNLKGENLRKKPGAEVFQKMWKHQRLSQAIATPHGKPMEHGKLVLQRTVEVVKQAVSRTDGKNLSFRGVVQAMSSTVVHLGCSFEDVRLDVCCIFSQIFAITEYYSAVNYFFANLAEFAKLLNPSIPKAHLKF